MLGKGGRAAPPKFLDEMAAAHYGDQSNPVQEDGGRADDLHRYVLDVWLLVVDPSALDDLKFLTPRHRSSHVDKYRRRVGCLSASQFSREYGRFFGSAPAKDVARLREQGFGASDGDR